MKSSAFTLLEVILSLIIASLVMAAIGPALVGTLRAQCQVRTVLEPLAAEQSTLAILRDDLIATPQPNGSVTQPFTAATTQVGGHRGDTLTFTTNGAPALHPTVALRQPELGQATITWALRAADDGRGLAWTRARQANLLASGVRPEPVAEIMLDHLTELTVETLVDGTWTTTYDSTQHDDVLPMAVRVGYSFADAQGEAGQRHVAVIDLPQSHL